MSKQELKTSVAPLTSSMKQVLVLRGATVALPGASLRIEERFKLKNMHWLLVSDKKQGTDQEIAVVWICRRQEGTYIAVLPAFVLYDQSDLSEVACTVLEVVSSEELRVLSEQELDAIVPHMQAEVVGRRIWGAQLQDQVFQEDLEQAPGPFVDGSDRR